MLINLCVAKYKLMMIHIQFSWFGSSAFPLVFFSCQGFLFTYSHFLSQHLYLCLFWQIPSAPVSEDDYSLARSRTSPVSSRSSEQYHSLMALLRKQHEVRTRLSLLLFCFYKTKTHTDADILTWIGMELNSILKDYHHIFNDAAFQKTCFIS